MRAPREDRQEYRQGGVCRVSNSGGRERGECDGPSLQPHMWTRRCVQRFKEAPLGASSRSGTEGIKLIKSAKNLSEDRGTEGTSYEDLSPQPLFLHKQSPCGFPARSALQRVPPSRSEERHRSPNRPGSGWKGAIRENYADC